jgi:hypothetical protein
VVEKASTTASDHHAVGGRLLPYQSFTRTYEVRFGEPLEDWVHEPDVMAVRQTPYTLKFTHADIHPETYGLTRRRTGSRGL